MCEDRSKSKIRYFQLGRCVVFLNWFEVFLDQVSSKRAEVDNVFLCMFQSHFH